MPHIPAKKDTGAPGGRAVCEEQRVNIWRVGRAGSILRTEATCVEAVKQAKAPFTLAVCSDLTIQSILVTAYFHLSSALQGKIRR